MIDSKQFAAAYAGDEQQKLAAKRLAAEEALKAGKVAKGEKISKTTSGIGSVIGGIIGAYFGGPMGAVQGASAGGAIGKGVGGIASGNGSATDLMGMGKGAASFSSMSKASDAADTAKTSSEGGTTGDTDLAKIEELYRSGSITKEKYDQIMNAYTTQGK